MPNEIMYRRALEIEMHSFILSFKNIYVLGYSKNGRYSREKKSKEMSCCHGKKKSNKYINKLISRICHVVICVMKKTKMGAVSNGDLCEIFYIGFSRALRDVKM